MEEHSLTLGAHLLLWASILLAQGGYNLSWWTVAGGGGKSRQGGYSLIGTAGQAEAGALMRGGAHELTGGFWGAGGQAEHNAYLPIVLWMSP